MVAFADKILALMVFNKCSKLVLPLINFGKVLLCYRGNNNIKSLVNLSRFCLFYKHFLPVTFSILWGCQVVWYLKPWFREVMMARSCALRAKFYLVYKPKWPICHNVTPISDTYVKFQILCCPRTEWNCPVTQLTNGDGPLQPLGQ